MTLSIFSRLLFNSGKVILCIHANTSPFHICQDQSKFPHVYKIIVPKIIPFYPFHLLQSILQFFPQVPCSLCIKCRIFNPLSSIPWITLKNFHRRNIHQTSLRSILSQSCNAKDFLHGSLSPFQYITCQRFQAIPRSWPLDGSPRSILQPSHVHGITSKSFHINSLIPHDMPIKTKVMPYSQYIFTFKEFLEFLQYPKCIIQIINP
mmetsp:Transcript_16039/g.30274  ORF Transcript_16039/g.30274 Transcript_16039/m.30274 type:complete len:206 (-) Transcript_16039:1215-1832(-)